MSISFFRKLFYLRKQIGKDVCNNPNEFRVSIYTFDLFLKLNPFFLYFEANTK